VWCFFGGKDIFLDISIFGIRENGELIVLFGYLCNGYLPFQFFSG
jgi:hypothetical protein